MGRFVRRGSTGIALIDTSGQKPQLRYVFDVADTGEREHSRPVHLWQFRAEHEDAIAATLERSYDVSGSNGIVEQMESAAAQLVKEYWVDNKRDILYNIDDSYLDGYDEFNTEVQFRNAAKASITYMLMSRCGLEPEAYMEPEDFMPVFDFNTPAAVAALGTAVSEISQQVLRQIEVAIRNYERERSQKMTELIYMKNGDYRIPDLKLSEEPGSKPLGKYGMLRKTYLQEHRPILWNQMILSETLFPHLREIDETARQRLEQMMPELMKSAGVTEALKASDPMKWVGLMNTLKAQAEETILTELVFS